MRKSPPLQAPFPWFGGKSRVASVVWELFGDVPNYVEPFFGSGAVLLARPHQPRLETVNDIDGFVCNFWRSVSMDPEQTADYADLPVNECDLHARHVWLKERRENLSRQLEGDPDFYDSKIAGWWVWGIASWIGGGFCGDSGSGPWQVVDSKLINLGKGIGVTRQIVHLGNQGKGVSRRRIHLGHGKGVSRRRIAITNDGVGITRMSGGIYDWLNQLALRLKRVRVCCGDWTRVLGPCPTFKQGVTGIFLDPPYSDKTNRAKTIYAEDNHSIAIDVAKWAIENGANPLLRIALCGYEGEHEMPQDWSCYAWKTSGGYANIGKGQSQMNCHRERIWFNPHCLERKQLVLFPIEALERSDKE